MTDLDTLDISHYMIVRDAKGETLSVSFSDGTTKQIPETHPHYGDIRELLGSAPLDEIDPEYVLERMNIIATVGQKLSYVSERVRVEGNNLYFDGDIIDNSLSQHILRLLKEDSGDASWKALVNFLEKVATNPSDQSIDSIYSWIKDRNLTITPDGDIIAYKGVAIRSDNTSVSINHGKAIVNGEVVQGAIPNNPGSVIEMPRSEVDANVNNGCSTGLHAGTWDYAYGFARDRVLIVKINPRDIVSVPNDCDFQKLRVSRYVVLSETDIERPEFVLEEDEDDLEDWDYDYDYDYDYDEYDDDYEEEGREHYNW